MLNDWADLLSDLQTRYDGAAIESINALYALHSFFYSAFPKDDYQPSSELTDAIVISEYGQNALSEIATSDISPSNIALACLLVFYHRDFLIDVRTSNSQVVMRHFGDELERHDLRLPHRFRRTLYDKFNALPEMGRIDELDEEAVETLLEGTDQGIYQVGEYVVGPLGILRSQEPRFVPPANSLPLWHCSDPGCEHLHHVKLSKRITPAYDLAADIFSVLSAREGDPFNWDRAFAELQHRPSLGKGKDYYDLPVLMADGLSHGETSTLLVDALGDRKLSSLRATLENVRAGMSVGSAEKIAQRLSQDQTLQLLLTLPDASLIGLIDSAALNRKIKIPPTETRKAKSSPPKVMQDDSSATISMLGVRTDRPKPILYLSSVIWNEYEKSGQLSELAWRCQMGSAPATPGLPLDYMRSHSPRDAIRYLVLPSQPITMSIAARLKLQFGSGESEDQTIDRFLWKFGFDFARFDRKYQRLRNQLLQLKQEAVRAPIRLSHDDRDAIRSKGVNVFVSLENFIEELVAFNVWLLSSDLFHAKFRYKFEEAVAQVPKILGASLSSVSNEVFWNSNGGNTLGTSLTYARAASNWMQNLSGRDRKFLEKSQRDLPFFAEDPISRFPFQHYEFWADTQAAELNNYAQQFDAIVSQLERSRLSEVRNGLDHFREEDKFPEIDTIIASERRLTEALDAADLNRFIPKPFWLIERSIDEFDREEFIFQDYDGQKLILRRPSAVRGLRPITFSEPWIVPYGNLLGSANSELTLHHTEESSYSRLWEKYPKRRQHRAVGESLQGSETKETEQPEAALAVLAE